MVAIADMAWRRAEQVAGILVVSVVLGFTYMARCKRPYLSLTISCCSRPHTAGKHKETQRSAVVSNDSLAIRRLLDSNAFRGLKVLPSFDSRFKNPCWYENNTCRNFYENNAYFTTKINGYHHQLMRTIFQNVFETRCSVNQVQRQLRCLPYYYIIGVAKCGTTDIARRIHRHPDVACGVLKEPSWWTWGRFGKQNNNSEFIHFV